MNYLAHFLDGHEVVHSNLIGDGIDTDFSHVHSPGVRAIGVPAVILFVPMDVRRRLVLAGGFEGTELLTVSPASLREFLGRIPLGKVAAAFKRLLQPEGGRLHQLAYYHAGAGSHRGAAVGHLARVRLDDFHPVVVNPQRLGDNLAEDGVRSLPDLRAGRQNSHPAFRRGFQTCHGSQLNLARAGKSGPVHEGSKADAFLLATRLVLPSESLDFCVVIRELKRPLHQTPHVHLLSDDLPGGRGLAFAEEIPPPQLFRAQADGTRHFVHLALQSKGGLWGPEAPKGPVRRRVRRHRAAANAHVRAEIGPGGVNRAPRKHDRGQRGVGAAVNDVVHLHP